MNSLEEIDLRKLKFNTFGRNTSRKYKELYGVKLLFEHYRKKNYSKNKNMKKIICLLTFVLAIFSCSNNDKEVAELVKDKVETMSGHEIVRDLLIENEGDVEQVARIFKCSVSTINRVKDRETYFTDNALSEFKNFLVAVKVSGKDTYKENDPYYDSWVRSFRYWLNKYVYWAIAGFVLFFIIGFSGGDAGFAGYIDALIVIVFGGGYLITWLFNWIWRYEQPVNLFIEKINPLFETLL